MLQDTIFTVFKTLFITAFLMVASMFFVILVDLKISIDRVYSVIDQSALTLSSQNYLSDADIAYYNGKLSDVVGNSATLFDCRISGVYDDVVGNFPVSDLERLQSGSLSTLSVDVTLVKSLLPILSWNDGFTVTVINSDGTLETPTDLSADTLYNNKQRGTTYNFSKVVYCSRSLKD